MPRPKDMVVQPFARPKGDTGAASSVYDALSGGRRGADCDGVEGHRAQLRPAEGDELTGRPVNPDAGAERVRVAALVVAALDHVLAK